MIIKDIDCDLCGYDGTTMCNSCIHEYTDKEDYFITKQDLNMEENNNE